MDIKKNERSLNAKPKIDMKWATKLRKYDNKISGRKKDSISSRSHSTKTNDIQFTELKNQEMIKPSSLDAPFYKDITSHVLSFKCSFCETYILTLQSFIIHLKSSHPNEDISEMLNDHFRSCIALVKKEKVVIISYAFPNHDIDPYMKMHDDASSNSDISLSSPKNINCNRNLEYQDDSKNDSLISTKITSNTVNAERWKNVLHSKYWLNTFNNKNENEKINGISNFQNDAQFMENLSQEISNNSLNQTLRNETKDYTSNITAMLLAENTRRRQMSNFEKMMALTCQKCGQKFKNRCMLTRHIIDHKRADNPYRCTINGCLDSYTEKRKLIAHLNYKHAELSKEEREAMIMKGDKLIERLHNISSNRSSTCYSEIVSPTIDITGQMISLKDFPSLSQAETTSISINAITTTNNDQSLIPTSATTDIISTNHILRNMIENVEYDGNGENLLEQIKSEIINVDNFDIAQCIANITASKCSSIGTTGSLTLAHNRLLKIETNKKIKLNTSTSNTITLKRNFGNRSLTMRDKLLNSLVANKRKVKKKKKLISQRNESIIS
ncbi:Hypermethylated in cancer 2 protein [Dirofilaria immitis]